MTIHYQPGEYWGDVVDHGLTEAQTGTPQLYVRFLVLGKVSAVDPEQYDEAGEQYERTVYRPITDKTIDFVTEDMERLDFHGTMFEDFKADGPGDFDIRGTQFKFFCKHEVYNHVQKEKWSIARERTTTPVADDAMKRLQTTFGKYLKPLAKSGPAAASSGPATGSLAPPAESPPAEVSVTKADQANAEMDKAAGDDSIPF